MQKICWGGFEVDPSSGSDEGPLAPRVPSDDNPKAVTMTTAICIRTLLLIIKTVVALASK